MLRGRVTTRVLAGCAAVAAALAVSAASGTQQDRRASLAGRVSWASRPAAVTVFPQVHVGHVRPTSALAGGYVPAQIRAAYFLNPLLRSGVNGKKQSIIIVDSFGSPTIAHDLRAFDRRFKLAAPPALKIIHPAGPIPAYKPTYTRLSWAAETTLDVEWAHVMAPAARIVLVETPTSENEGTSGFPQIVTAEKYVISHHLGGVISQSFGATEETFPKGTLRPLRGAYIAAALPANNITVVSASGDAGATDYRSDMTTFYTKPVTSWPASDPLVTSVGGLDLRLDRLGRRTAPDQVWNDGAGFPSAGGGGKSVIFGRPTFQNAQAAIVGAHRGVPDISLSASCTHPVYIFQSFDGSGLTTICGTSEATPIFAGIIALADQIAGHPLGPINGDLYKMAAAHDPGIVDITRGNNTVRFSQNGTSYTVPGWAAVPGYDLSSGLGSVNARWFVQELAALAR